MNCLLLRKKKENLFIFVFYLNKKNEITKKPKSKKGIIFSKQRIYMKRKIHEKENIYEKEVAPLVGFYKGGKHSCLALCLSSTK